MGRVARLQGSAAVTSGTMPSGSFYTTSPQEWPACAVLGAFVCLGIVARRAVCGASWGLSGRKKSADRSRRRFSQNNCDIPPLFRGRPAANPPKIGPFPHLPPPVPPFPAFLRYVVPVQGRPQRDRSLKTPLEFQPTPPHRGRPGSTLK